MGSLPDPTSCCIIIVMGRLNARELSTVGQVFQDVSGLLFFYTVVKHFKPLFIRENAIFQIREDKVFNPNFFNHFILSLIPGMAFKSSNRLFV